MTMPETTQSDLVERREALSFNLYLECAGLQNPSECFPVGGDFTSMAELLALVEQAERDAFEITRLRAHCEALAKGLTTAERQISAAFGIIHPGDKGLLEGSLESIRQPLAAYRKENSDVL